MAGRWFLIGLAVLTGCCFVGANAQAGLVDSNTVMVSSPLRTWNGFEAEFSPEWEGDTTVVDTWQAPEISGIYSSDTGYDLSSATIMATNWGFIPAVDYDPGHWEIRPTVRKISSSSDSKVLNTAWLRHAGQEYRATKNDDGGAEMARYAMLVSPRQQLTQVVTQDGLPGFAMQTVEEQLLAVSTSIASRNTSFGDDEFSADGRVSASAILNYAAKEAVAGSTGRSWLEATYELDRETDFSLDLDLAIRGQIDFSFTATDVDSGEVAFHFDTLPHAISIGTQQEFSMDGTLEAGTYEFALNCLADATVNSLGQWNPGGQAKFDLSLDLKEEYVQVWVPDSVWFSDFSLARVALVEGGDFSDVNDVDATILATNWQSGIASVPEPSALAMLILGGLGCLIAGRRQA